MSLWNYLKKKGKRIAGTYGRINHKDDMRAASKGVRRYRDITEEIMQLYDEDPNFSGKYTTEELLENDETPECEHRHVEYHRYYPGTRETPEEPEGYYCLDCNTWLEPPDEATRLGI